MAIWVDDPMAMFIVMSILFFSAIHTAVECSAALPIIATMMMPMKIGFQPSRPAAPFTLPIPRTPIRMPPATVAAPSTSECRPLCSTAAGSSSASSAQFSEQRFVGLQRKKQRGDVSRHEENAGDPQRQVLDIGVRRRVRLVVMDRKQRRHRQRQGRDQQIDRVRLGLVLVECLDLVLDAAREDTCAQHQQ